MGYHVGGGPRVKYGISIFRWLDDRILMIEDYPYEGTYFCGDLDLALPEDKQCGDLTKKESELNVFMFFMIF